MQDKNTRIGVGHSHGKLILMGEHAVVYGHKAIAMNFFPKAIQAQVTSSERAGVYLKSFLYEGNIEAAPLALENLTRTILLTLKGLEKADDNLIMEIKSQLSPGSGLGSSAAVIVACVRAIYDYYQLELSDEKLIALTDYGEQIAHGNHSGIDARATALNRTFVYSKTGGIQDVDLNLGAYLVVASTGLQGQTKEAVKKIADRRALEPTDTDRLIAKLGEYAEYAQEIIASRKVKRLGALMNNVQNILRQLGVSHPKLDLFIETAQKAGAIGAKLTGGGLGGCMIALADDEATAAKIATELEKLGATLVWMQVI